VTGDFSDENRHYARFRITMMRLPGIVDLSGIENEIYAC